MLFNLLTVSASARVQIFFAWLEICNTFLYTQAIRWGVMKRRNVLQYGVGVATSGLLPVSVTSSVTSGERSLPHESTPSVTIRPRRDPESCRLVPIPDDVWVVHQFGVVGDANEPVADLRRLRDRAEYRFEIDGDVVDPDGANWLELAERDDGGSELNWEYAVPPRSPGLHSFQVEVHFPEPVVTGRRTGDRQRWAGTYWFGVNYEVTPARETRSLNTEIADQVFTSE